MIANYYQYYVSKEGHVYDTKTNFEIPIWITSKTGYCNVSLYLDGKRRIKKVHRLVALIYIPNSDELLYSDINHKDGDKENNNVDNLEWSNSYLNNKHARETGLNDISKSNKERWKNNQFSQRTRKNMSNAAKNRNMVGKKNPNFKFTLLRDNVEYTLKEFSMLMGISYSALYHRLLKLGKLDGCSSFELNGDIIYIHQG